MEEPKEDKLPCVYKVLLMVLPVGVVVGTIVFMIAYFYMEREEEMERTVIVSHGLRVSDLEDMVDKFTDRIGERNIDTERGRIGLRRAASMIEGRLGPQNVGFPVRKCQGEAAYGLLWKSLSVEIRGEGKPEEVVFAAVSFSGEGEVADANCVSTLMMLAQSMARVKPVRTLRFVFLPADRTPAEQNQWLLRRCLKPGEVLAGVVGLKTMQGAPETGVEDWQPDDSVGHDKAWWEFLSSGGERPGGQTLAVWVTHPVFSSEAWIGKKRQRLERSLGAAREIRGWLLRAAE